MIKIGLNPRKQTELPQPAALISANADVDVVVVVDAVVVVLVVVLIYMNLKGRPQDLMPRQQRDCQRF